MYRKPYVFFFFFFFDPGQHFDNRELQNSYYERALPSIIAYRGSSKSIGMVEISSKLLEDVLRKDSKRNGM